MATKKIYTIEIQMDAARNALADANKRLSELDASLEGLDRNSDAAKDIIAQMAKAAKEVEQLTEEVGGLGSALDNLKPGTIGALREEAKRLEAALEGALKGTAEADALIAELGRVKAELKDIDESVDVAFSRDRAGALVDAVSGVASAFTIATVAAQNFGLSSEDADKYNQKLLECISIVQSLEQVHKLTTGEVRTALKGVAKDTIGQIKNVFALGKAYILGGEQATIASRVTRGALLATGVGALVVLVGLLISNFDKVKAVAGEIRQKFKPQFDAISDFIDGAIAKARDLASALTFGLVDNAATAAVKAAEEKADQLTQLANEARTRRIAVLEAEGQETYGIKARQLAEELKLLKKALKEGGEEERKAFLDKANEINILYAQFQKKQKDDALKARQELQLIELTTLQARINLLAAQGEETINLQLDFKKRELEFLLSAETRNAAAIIAKRGEIAVLVVTARRQQLQQEFDALKEATDNLERLEVIDARESEKRKAEALLKLREELGQEITAGTAKILDDIQQQAQARAEAAVQQQVPLGEKLLIKLFGLRADQVDAVKEQIGQAVASIQQSLAEAANGLLTAALAETDVRLTDAQARLSEIDQRLNEQASRAAQSEQALATATGARRDFLIGKLAKERSEEERLRAAKAKAAKEEQAALKERHRLEVAGQKITAASTLATSAYNAVLAVNAAIEAVKMGAKLPPPASLLAIAAGVAAVGAAVVAARSFGKTIKLEQGGLLRGPRHSAGGIAVGDTGIEVEGGEYVLNRRATAMFLPEIERMNAIGRTRVLPPPRRTYADGGQLPQSLPGGGLPAGTVLVKEADLSETNALLRQIAQHTGIEAAKPIPRLIIGQPEALAIDEQRKSAQAIIDYNR